MDTEELVQLVDALEACQCDIVLTDYEIVNMQDRSMTPVRVKNRGVHYGEIYHSFYNPKKTLPSIHATTYKTSLLRNSGFAMQDEIFFVDEEYVVLPYLSAQDVIYYPFDIYRYQVANPQQSTSPKNRAKYYNHREKILKRLIQEYHKAQSQGCLEDKLSYCLERIQRGIGDHFTTLLIYIEDRKEGRRLAKQWEKYVKRNAPEFWHSIRKKVQILSWMNRFSISQSRYVQLKDRFYHRKTQG